MRSYSYQYLDNNTVHIQQYSGKPEPVSHDSVKGFMRPKIYRNPILAIFTLDTVSESKWSNSYLEDSEANSKPANPANKWNARNVLRTATDKSTLMQLIASSCSSSLMQLAVSQFISGKIP